MDLPIPMTVPNSDFLSSFALTAMGQMRMRAKIVKHTREMEPRKFRLCLLVGRRAERGIMVRVEGKVRMLTCFVSDARVEGNVAKCHPRLFARATQPDVTYRSM